jgi:hypothetical protein
MHEGGDIENHLKFKEWSALAQGGALNASEWQELEKHLSVCDSCRELFEEYSLISAGMPLLGANYSLSQDCEGWDDRRARRKLLARVRETEQPGLQLVPPHSTRPAGGFFPGSIARFSAAAVGIAACVVAVAMAGYHLHARLHGEPASNAVVAAAHFQDSNSQHQATQATDETLRAQAAEISRLQYQVSTDEQELAKLKAASARASENYASALATAHTNQEQIRQISEQRDKLAVQLREAEQAYQNVQLELTNLRAERDRAVLRATSLESKVDELNVSNRDQERRLGDDEQYLASDRDIRELMGARKLYIADVFDVDSRSRTRKPFGRVFYTQNKSLIFYAFDLDREPGVKNASAFQVWGQRDNELGEKAHPMNLGILYMDSESNRRWVLRFDDSKQLAEIDAVFVTVEPHGGSQKPTGKPLLYALLRKEANHP